MSEAVKLPNVIAIQTMSPDAAIYERALRDPSIDVEKARQILELRYQMEDRAGHRAFNTAMSAAQAAMAPVRKDANNPQTRSKYASFLALDHAIRPIYTGHGFSVSFDTGDSPSETMVRVLAYVAHSEGHSQTFKLDIPADGKGAKGGDVMTKTHATMSAVSYGKRGLLKMIFNIAEGEIDDDGNAAGKAESRDPVNPEQLKKIQEALVQYGVGIDWLLEFLSKRGLEIGELPQTPASYFSRVMTAIKAKAEQSK